MATEIHTPKRLTAKVLDGLFDALGELEMLSTAGWEGTPYECRSEDDDCRCEKCVARWRMESAMLWLGEFIRKKREAT